MSPKNRTILLGAVLMVGCGPHASVHSDGESGGSDTGVLADDWIVGQWHLGKGLGSADLALNFDFYGDGTVVPSGDWCGAFGTGDPGTWELNADNTVTAQAAPGGSLNGDTEILFSRGTTCSSMTGVSDKVEVPYERGLVCILPVPCEGTGECDCGEMVWCDSPPELCE